MKPVRTLMATLMVTGLASVGYASPSAPAASQTFSAISLAGAVASALPQEEQKPKDAPESKPSNAGRDEQKPRDTPAGKPADTAKPEKAAKPQDQPDKTQPQKHQDEKQDKNQAKQDKKDQSQDHNRNENQDQTVARHDNQPAGHQGSSRQVSDSDRKAHFGQQHHFSARQVITTTTIVPNQTRFVYTGYTFVFADPWPAEWALDDDCYIDYVDGEYFMFDPVHPGVRIALTIVG